LGVFGTLASQHRSAIVLLTRAATTTAAARRLELWKEVCAELASHEQAELEEVYSELAKHDELFDLAQRHEADARQLHKAIASVDAEEMGTEAWSVALDSLLTKVRRHAELEETEVFPVALEVLDEQTARLVDLRYRVAKQAVLEARVNAELRESSHDAIRPTGATPPSARSARSLPDRR
jgi:hypothetical protein